MEEDNTASRAVAIHYDKKAGEAPRIVARGKGVVAEKIIATAKEAGIYVQQDENLVELLAQVDIGSEVPLELYQTVAEVLAFVYRVNAKFKDKLDGRHPL